MDETANVKIPPPLFYLIPLAIGIIVNISLPLDLFPEWWLGHILGWPLIICSILLQGWAMRTMFRAGTSMNIRKPTTTIVSTGPYSFSRNPMYFSLTLLYSGITLVMNTIWPLIFLPVVLLFINYGIIVKEEIYLERRFGDEYRRYKTRVHRWL